MPLVYAAFCPHAPVLVPEIAKGEVKESEPTEEAMIKLAERFIKAKPDILIIASPHAPIFREEMGVCAAGNLVANFSGFGVEIARVFKNSKETVAELKKLCAEHNLPLSAYDEYDQPGYEEFDEHELDHGVFVPLYFLQKAGWEGQVVPVAISDLGEQLHKKFGHIIAELAKHSKKRIAFIASGDLSHTGSTEGPMYFQELGEYFDELVLDALEAGKSEAVLNIDETLQEEVTDNGIITLAVLTGVLGREFETKVLSYQAPYGVGYLVADFKLNQ